jgi:hypothetical protein
VKEKELLEAIAKALVDRPEEVNVHVVEGEEVIVLERPVEPLVHRVVLRRARPGEILGNAKPLAGAGKILLELAPVVVSHVLDLAVEKRGRRGN